MNKNGKDNDTLASLLLRIGLAAVLVYASVSSLISPQDWIGYLPHILTSLIPGDLLLRIFSGYETALAVWLLSGIYLRYAAGLAALTFSGIFFSNLGLLVITFRDITMIFASLALMVMKVDKPKQ